MISLSPFCPPIPMFYNNANEPYPSPGMLFQPFTDNVAPSILSSRELNMSIKGYEDEIRKIREKCHQESCVDRWKCHHTTKICTLKIARATHIQNTKWRINMDATWMLRENTLPVLPTCWITKEEETTQWTLRKHRPPIHMGCSDNTLIEAAYRREVRLEDEKQQDRLEENTRRIQELIIKQSKLLYQDLEIDMELFDLRMERRLLFPEIN